MRHAFPLLLQIALCSCAFAADASLDEVRTTYQSQLDKITAAGGDAMTALGDQVLTALTKAADAARQANDPAAKDIAREIERWKTEGEPPAAESSIPAIAKIHQVYRTQKEAKTAERNRQVAAWFKSYDARLTSLKDADAEAVKAEREKIGDSFLVKEALAAAPVTGAPKPAEPPKPAAPSSFSASQPSAPWLSLNRIKWTTADGDAWVVAALNAKDPFTFNGKEYKARDFLYLHGGGTLTYTFKNPITAFKAVACIPEGSHGNVFFVFTTDEGEVFRTKPVTAERSEAIEITFKPTTRLIIKSDPNGGTQEDWSHLLEPKYR